MRQRQGIPWASPYANDRRRLFGIGDRGSDVKDSPAAGAGCIEVPWIDRISYYDPTVAVRAIKADLACVAICHPWRH
jgi:hypothetical protein